MQKTFCDICQKEIESDSQSGSYGRLVENYIPRGLVPVSQRSDGDLFVRVMDRESFDACEECTDKVFEFIEKLKMKLLKISKRELRQLQRNIKYPQKPERILTSEEK